MATTRPDNHYQTLGLRPDVTAAEIKRAYRKLVKSCHPDFDHHAQSQADRQEKTERMMRLNEAYETLMDRSKRQAYDVMIGLYRVSATTSSIQFSIDEDQARERYLKQVFNPARQSVSRVLQAYEKELRALSQDIYDDQLLAEFENYVESVEIALRKSSNAFSENPWPCTLDAAVHMMRHCIAQASDGLDEIKRFCQNFDYDHLCMAETLFRIARDLSRQSGRLTRA